MGKEARAKEGAVDNTLMEQYPRTVIEGLIRIMAGCDGGCFICVGSLFESIRAELPELTPIAHKIFLEEVGYSYLTNE